MNTAAAINNKTSAATALPTDLYDALTTFTAMFTEQENQVITRADRAAHTKGLNHASRAHYVTDKLATAAAYDTYDEAYAALMGPFDGRYPQSMLQEIAPKVIGRDTITGLWRSGLTHGEFGVKVWNLAYEITTGTN